METKRTGRGRKIKGEERVKEAELHRKETEGQKERQRARENGTAKQERERD